MYHYFVWMMLASNEHTMPHKRLNEGRRLNGSFLYFDFSLFWYCAFLLASIHCFRAHPRKFFSLQHKQRFFWLPSTRVDYYLFSVAHFSNQYETSFACWNWNLSVWFICIVAFTVCMLCVLSGNTRGATST